MDVAARESSKRAILAPVIASLAIVKPPPSAMVASAETSLKTASRKTLKSTLLRAPPSLMSSSSASTTSPVIAVALVIAATVTLAAPSAVSIEVPLKAREPPAPKSKLSPLEPAPSTVQPVVLLHANEASWALFRGMYIPA